MGISKEKGKYYQEKWEEMEYRFANIEMKNKIERLENIIKEVRKKIYKAIKESELIGNGNLNLSELLEILDKE